MTKYTPGTFSWLDLGTTDLAGAKKFYGELFGWTYQDNPVSPEMTYSMCQLNNKDVAAIYDMDAEQKAQGMPPYWMSYVTVASADEAANKAKELGATLMMEPMDVFDAGRMALLQDPTNAMLAIWEPKSHIGAKVVNEPGTLTWNELATNDTATAEKFYTGLFGWKSESADMGGFTYTSYSVGDRPNGGMMQIGPDWGDVPPHWGVYFAVADCDGSVEKAKSLGGNLLMGPQDIPEVGRFAVLQDPQGGTFNIIQLLNPQ